MRVWRMASAAFPLFDGEGARRYGGRWTPRGRPAVYTSATLSLAALERVVHFDPDLDPSDLVAVPADIPSVLAITTIEIAALPANWREYPAPDSLALIGEAWLETARTLLLSVPSVVIPHERNYVINPGHRDARRLVVGPPEPFAFDPRLRRRRRPLVR